MTPSTPSSLRNKMHTVPGERRLQLHISEDETLVVLRALEIHPKNVAGGAVRAVATDEPRRFDDLFTTVVVTQSGADPVARLHKAVSSTPRSTAIVKACQALDEETLRFRLRQAKRERERTCDRVEIDLCDRRQPMMQQKPMQMRCPSARKRSAMPIVPKTSSVRGKIASALEVCERSAARSIIRQGTP